MGGGLRFESPSRANAPNTQTRMGLMTQAGQLKGGLHALHIASTSNIHWHAGISVRGFGASQVPQRRFAYLGRVYQLETGELTNTAGRAGHAVLGLERETPAGRSVAWSMRLSDVNQGLFPGIVGLPRQGDLSPNDGLLEIRLPSQHASRVQTLVKWSGAESGVNAVWGYTVSGSWNQRREYAPPHAHGWGPLPDSDLSLSLEEWTAFGEARRNSAHGSIGMQFEGQHVTTTGWEFLLPSHQRMRLSTMGEFNVAHSVFLGRLDVVYSQQGGHSEPLYNSEGVVVGTDVRALEFDTLMPGGMLSWQRPLSWKDSRMEGLATLVAYGRVPSNHEWGANGIHHGSFRFEQGNPQLGTEWALEGRLSLDNGFRPMGWGWKAQAFAALHYGFISITPSAQFAPVSHAGQIYDFRANDAFRTGLEAEVNHTTDRQTLSFVGSGLGQWDLSTGLGLPFTTPSQARISWEGRTLGGFALRLSGLAVAPSVLTARNENTTPGALLADITLSQTTARGQCTLDVSNLFNRAWLDHTSAYRSLGLVSQGRWVQIRFTTTLKHHQTQE